MSVPSLAAAQTQCFMCDKPYGSDRPYNTFRRKDSAVSLSVCSKKCMEAFNAKVGAMNEAKKKLDGNVARRSLSQKSVTPRSSLSDITPSGK